MEGFFVIGNSAARSAGSAGRAMTRTAAIAPCLARLATLTIMSWYTDRRGLSRIGEAVNDQRSVKVSESREQSTLDPKPQADGS